MAAPHVAGAVAVMASNFPELTGRDITTILLETARDVGAPGVDAVYGHGILDLTNAVAPQGALTLKTGETLSAGSVPLTESHIFGKSAVGQALQASLAGQPLMVTDHYNRGYYSDMGAFVSLRPAVSMDNVDAFTRNPMPNADRARDTALFANPYATLAEGVALTQETTLGAATLAVSGTFSDTTTYGLAALHTSVGPHLLTAGLGRLSESGALLGTDITGAFGTGLRTDTHFARIGADLAAGGTTRLHLAASRGHSAFTSDGILAAGDDIITTTFDIGVRQDNVFQANDQFLLGLSQPLSITGGTLTVNAPVGLQAASNGMRSEDVLRNTSTTAMRASDMHTDLTLAYAMDTDIGRLAMGGVWQTGAETPTFGLSIGWSHSY